MWAVFSISAFWHGFFPGYCVLFLTRALPDWFVTYHILALTQKNLSSGFLTKRAQTSLLSYRDRLEKWNFACSQFRYDRVPTSSGKAGKSQIKVPWLEKSWNFGKKGGKIVDFWKKICVWQLDFFFWGVWWFTGRLEIKGSLVWDWQGALKVSWHITEKLMAEYGFCLMNENQDCRQNWYPLFNAGRYEGPFVRVRLF